MGADSPTVARAQPEESLPTKPKRQGVATNKSGGRMARGGGPVAAGSLRIDEASVGESSAMAASAVTPVATNQTGSTSLTTAITVVKPVVTRPRRWDHRDPITIMPTVATVAMMSRPTPISRAGIVSKGPWSTTRATVQVRAARRDVAARSGVLTR